MTWLIKNIFSNRKIATGIIFVIIFGSASIWIDVTINDWFRDFYDALFKKSYIGLGDLIFKFTILALFQIVIQTISSYISDIIESLLRNSLTIKLFNLANQFKIDFDKSVKYSDQRISEDVEIFSNKFVFIFINFFINFLKAIVFSLILVKMSPPIILANTSFHGSLAIIALLYFTIPTYITYKLGLRLAKIEDKKRRFEAQLRYNLINLNKEKNIFFKNRIFKNIGIITFIQNISAKLHAIIFGTSTAFNLYSMILPLIILVPYYLDGSYEFGELVKAAAAFNILQSCLTYLFNFYRDVVKCFAASSRIYNFVLQLEGK